MEYKYPSILFGLEVSKFLDLRRTLIELAVYKALRLAFHALI